MNIYKIIKYKINNFINMIKNNKFWIPKKKLENKIIYNYTN